MGLVLVTDSSTCLPESLAAAFDICVLPISVHLPDELEELDTPGEAELRLPEAVEQDELTGANRPFVTEYLEAVERPDKDAAVIVTPAIEFSTMYRNAALAAELADRPTIAIDARTAAAGQALVVLAGAEAAKRGASLAEVAELVRDAARRVELVASLATLEPIRQSGPVPVDVLGTTELDGNRALFRMHNGTVEPLGSAVNAEETLEAIRAAFEKSAAGGIDRSAIFHAGVPELAARLEELIGPVDFVSGFSTAMQVHTGRGVVGAAWLPRRSP